MNLRIFILISLAVSILPAAAADLGTSQVTLIHVISSDVSAKWADRFLPAYLERGEPPEEWFFENPGIYNIGIFSHVASRRDLRFFTPEELASYSHIDGGNDRTVVFAFNPKPDAVWWTEKNSEELREKWRTWSNEKRNSEKPNRFTEAYRRKLESYRLPDHFQFYEDFKIIGRRDPHEAILINPHLIESSLLSVPPASSPTGEEVFLYHEEEPSGRKSTLRFREASCLRDYLWP